ncbi:hypothetical protein Plhal710r2_c028g0106981 [Plasmopara halstedii]
MQETCHSLDNWYLRRNNLFYKSVLYGANIGQAGCNTKSSFDLKEKITDSQIDNYSAAEEVYNLLYHDQGVQEYRVLVKHRDLTLVSLLRETSISG